MSNQRAAWERPPLPSTLLPHLRFGAKVLVMTLTLKGNASTALGITTTAIFPAFMTSLLKENR
jgi:hypothetical protein